MIVSYPPFYPQQILDADGKPVAGGRILSFYAGTDVPLAMFAPDGTSLGSSVSIASDGTAVFCLKVGVAYKLVCVDSNGATIWVRDRVKVSAGEGGGMVNPMENAGSLIYGGPDGDPTELPIGSQRTVLTSDGEKPSWEAPKVPAAPGDTRYKDSVHEAIDPAAPLKKGIRFASGGRAWMTLEIEPSDTEGDILQTLKNEDDEFFVGWGAGGGGGGGGGGSAGAAVWAVHPNIATTQQVAADTSWKTSLHKIFVPKLTPSNVAFALSSDVSHFAFTARVGIYTANRVLCYYGEASYASAPDCLGLNSNTGEFYSIPVSAVPTAPKTEFENEFVILAVSFPSYGSYRPSFLSYNAANSSVRKMTAPITSSMTTLPNPDGEILTRTCAVGIL